MTGEQIDVNYDSKWDVSGTSVVDRSILEKPFDVLTYRIYHSKKVFYQEEMGFTASEAARKANADAKKACKFLRENWKPGENHLRPVMYWAMKHMGVDYNWTEAPANNWPPKEIPYGSDTSEQEEQSVQPQDGDDKKLAPEEEKPKDADAVAQASKKNDVVAVTESQDRELAPEAEESREDYVLGKSQEPPKAVAAAQGCPDEDLEGPVEAVPEAQSSEKAPKAEEVSLFYLISIMR